MVMEFSAMNEFGDLTINQATFLLLGDLIIALCLALTERHTKIRQKGVEST